MFRILAGNKPIAVIVYKPLTEALGHVRAWASVGDREDLRRRVEAIAEVAKYLAIRSKSMHASLSQPVIVFATVSNSVLENHFFQRSSHHLPGQADAAQPLALARLCVFF